MSKYFSKTCLAASLPDSPLYGLSPLNLSGISSFFFPPFGDIFVLNSPFPLSPFSMLPCPLLPPFPFGLFFPPFLPLLPPFSHLGLHELQFLSGQQWFRKQHLHYCILYLNYPIHIYDFYFLCF